jgi:hypothetical protein
LPMVPEPMMEMFFILCLACGKLTFVNFMQKSRITNLSTRFLSLYKNTMLAFLLAALGSLGYMITDKPSSLIMFGIWAYGIWNFIRVNRKVFHVEFDDEFLYLIRKESDILIPLENIKDVELRTLGGLYEKKLYHPEVVGDLIYYKPSLLYPFNFKSKDRIADVLREKIEEAKRKPREYQKNALMS